MSNEENKELREPTGAGSDPLGSELNLFTLLGLTLTLSLFVLTLCFTLRLRYLNAELKTKADFYARGAQGGEELVRLGQRLLIDLSALGEKNPEVVRLLQENEGNLSLFGPLGGGG